jgi:hypothetical protein
MGKVIVNVFKHDESYIKTPSICEFTIDDGEGWQTIVEERVSNQFSPRNDYYLCFEYRRDRNR